MNEKKIKILILGVMIGICLLILFIVLFITKKNDDINQNTHETITENYNFSEVYDIDEYQSVYSSMINYFDSISSADKMLLMSKKWMKENNITGNNLDNFIESPYESYSYKIKNISKYFNSYFQIYFIKGDYNYDTFDGIIDSKSVTDILIMDKINNTYSIIPTKPEEDFKTILNKYNLLNYNEEIEKNNLNEIKYQAINEFNESMLYFNEIITSLAGDCQKAYSIMSEDIKKDYETLEKFQNICDLFNTNYIDPIIKQHTISYDKDGIKNINITDSYNIKYIIKLKSVTKYQVSLILPK